MASGDVGVAARSGRAGMRSQRAGVEIRSPKSEGRKKVEIRNPNKNFV
jgi:hypothetical protein